MKNNKYLSGIILIIIGLFLLLNKMDFFHYDFTYHIFKLPTIFIIVGVIILINNYKKITGYVFLAIGSLWHIADNYNLSFWDMVLDYWPVVFLIIGLNILFQRDKKASDYETLKKDYNHNNEKSKAGCTNGENMCYSESNDDFINSTVVFSGSKIVSNSTNFQGGKLTTIFGGTEINLIHTKTNAKYLILETTTMFGGCEIMVPKEWNVIVKVTPIFGGVDDKKFGYLIPNQDEAPTLEIKGLVAFGGCEVKYY